MFASKDDIKGLDRLKKRSDFLRVNAKCKKWVSRGIIVQMAPNDGQGKRFGLTVSKKTSPSAVDRNRIKRRLRAVAADVLPSLALDNTDYVLIGRPVTKTRPYQELVNDLKWSLKRLETKDG